MFARVTAVFGERERAGWMPEEAPMPRLTGINGGGRAGCASRRK